MKEDMSSIFANMVFAFWVLCTFESQMKKEVRNMREKHTEDVEFMLDETRLRNNARLSKISFWITQADRGMTLLWVTLNWKITARTERVEKKVAALGTQTQSAAKETVSVMDTKLKKQVVKTASVLASVARDRNRLQAFLHWRNVVGVAMATKNHAKELNKLTDRNTKLATDFSVLRREHGFAVAAQHIPRWEGFYKQVLLILCAIFWWQLAVAGKDVKKLRAHQKKLE